MNKEQQIALGLLPHGPEFRFVDRLTSLLPGRTGSGEYLVRGDEPFLKGHFPGHPLVPGVLLLEAGAQLAGVVAQSDPAQRPLHNLKLTALRAVKITGSAKPGETILIEAEVVGRLAGLVQANVKASVAGVPVMQGAVTLSGD